MQHYAIFDLDGTLLDSMSMWRNLGTDYLAKLGVVAPPDLLAKTTPMTLQESTAYMIKTLGLNVTPNQVIEAMLEMIEDKYKNELELKPGAKAYVENLHDQGVKMTIASATVERLIRACLDRHGIIDLFEEVLSCETLGVGKNEPTIYLEAAKTLNVEPSRIAVYEDSFYAGRTAKNAGFYLVGVYDINDNQPQRLKDLSHAYIEDFEMIDHAPFKWN